MHITFCNGENAPPTPRGQKPSSLLVPSSIRPGYPLLINSLKDRLQAGVYAIFSGSRKFDLTEPLWPIIIESLRNKSSCGETYVEFMWLYTVIVNIFNGNYAVGEGEINSLVLI